MCVYYTFVSYSLLWNTRHLIFGRKKIKEFFEHTNIDVQKVRKSFCCKIMVGEVNSLYLIPTCSAVIFLPIYTSLNLKINFAWLWSCRNHDLHKFRYAVYKTTKRKIPEVLNLQKDHFLTRKLLRLKFLPRI